MSEIRLVDENTVEFVTKQDVREYINKKLKRMESLKEETEKEIDELKKLIG